MAKRISILSMRSVDGFWQATALLEAAETLLTSDLDSGAYSEDAAREAFLHVFTVVSERSGVIRETVGGALLDTYNAIWRQGRTAKLTRAAFVKKLTFERIHASEPDHPSRLISLQLGASDLLGGHRIGCILGWDGTPLFAPALVP